MTYKTEIKINGFTLIELMIAIAIFVILLSMTVLNFRSSDKNKDLHSNANLVLAGIEQAQSMALSGQLVGGTIPDSYNFVIKLCKTGAGNCGYFLTASTTASSILIKSVSTTKAYVSSTGVTIGFAPPRANATISGGATSTVITLYHVSDPSILWYICFSSVSGRAFVTNNKADCQ